MRRVSAEEARSTDGLVAVDAATASQLRSLTESLERNGLAAFLAAFPPHSTRRARWRRELDGLDERLQALARLFLFGEPVPVSALPSAVAGGLAALVELGLADAGRDVRLRDVVLGRPLGLRGSTLERGDPNDVAARTGVPTDDLRTRRRAIV